MTVQHVVVDGSNLATEGRTLPSLQQLDDAVRSYIDEYKPVTVTVIVDASFPNRIDDAERAAFEEAVDAGEVISPPAGVIGRGDAFVLQIADKADAVVLSNDSFQEFHGQYGWLFDQGRLVGGKPVPHVGWVFMERSPVRGPASRRSVSDAKKAATKAAAAAKDGADKGRTAAKAPSKATGGRRRGGREDPRPEAAPEAVAGADRRRQRHAARRAPAAEPVKAAALSAASAGGGGGRRRRSGGGGAIEPYNEALPFIEFVGSHPVGSSVDGEVERFTSHGAYVLADGARCYLPLKHLADPPPRSAREVLSSGTTYTFVVHGFDTPRRGVDLTMPGVVPGSMGSSTDRGSAGDPVQPTEEERVAPAKKKGRSQEGSGEEEGRSQEGSGAQEGRSQEGSGQEEDRGQEGSGAQEDGRGQEGCSRIQEGNGEEDGRGQEGCSRIQEGNGDEEGRSQEGCSAAKRAPAKRKAAAKRAPARKATKRR